MVAIGYVEEGKLGEERFYRYFVNTDKDRVFKDDVQDALSDTWVGNTLDEVRKIRESTKEIKSRFLLMHICDEEVGTDGKVLKRGEYRDKIERLKRDKEVQEEIKTLCQVVMYEFSTNEKELEEYLEMRKRADNRLKEIETELENQLRGENEEFYQELLGEIERLEEVIEDFIGKLVIEGEKGEHSQQYAEAVAKLRKLRYLRNEWEGYLVNRGLLLGRELERQCDSCEALISRVAMVGDVPYEVIDRLEREYGWEEITLPTNEDYVYEIGSSEEGNILGNKMTKVRKDKLLRRGNEG